MIFSGLLNRLQSVLGTSTQLAVNMSRKMRRMCSKVFSRLRCLYQKYASSLMDWLSRPDVLVALATWSISFGVICALILALGFGPAGVGAGSAAAAFQAAMYGGLTPAGGVFAFLTSMGMAGTLVSITVAVASAVATAAAAAAAWAWTRFYGRRA